MREPRQRVVNGQKTPLIGAPRRAGARVGIAAAPVAAMADGCGSGEASLRRLRGTRQPDTDGMDSTGRRTRCPAAVPGPCPASAPRAGVVGERLVDHFPERLPRNDTNPPRSTGGPVIPNGGCAAPPLGTGPHRTRQPQIPAATSCCAAPPGPGNWARGPASGFSMIVVRGPVSEAVALPRPRVRANLDRWRLGRSKPKLRRRVGCKWQVTCEDFAESGDGRSQKDQGQCRP